MVGTLQMLAQLTLHEGRKLEIYLDTLGNETLGIGYNVTSRGLDEFSRTIQRKLQHVSGPIIKGSEADVQCVTDIHRVEKAVIVHWPYYLQLDEVRQRVVIDLAFNLGMRATAFVQTKAAIEVKDWSRAVRELFKSKWAYQADDGPGGKWGRADRLGQMLLTGRDYVS